MKIKYLAVAVASTLLAGHAVSVSAAQEGESAVTGAVRSVVQAVETAQTNETRAKAEAKAKAKAEKANQAKKADAAQDDYPAVPAKYLRPDADPDKKKQAVDQMKKNVDAQDKAAAEEKRRKSSTPVGQVKINTNGTISMRPGENVFIPISREHPNRILTPFKNPQIISTSLFTSKKKGECGEACVRDGVIYITTDSPSAVTAFITEKGHEDIAFSVTMIPQAIPPREVRFTLPSEVVERINSRRGSSVSNARKAQAWEQSQPYVETIRQALRSVALGQIPNGYNMRNMRVTDPTPTCKHLGLEFDWSKGQMLEGYNLDIYVGVVKNVADTPVEFRNQNCGGWRTAAVTSWPLTVLEPGQESEIYVVVKRQEDIPDEMVRKPLISREFN